MLRPAPLVDQAIADLSRRLRDGDWAVGTAIPPEPELAVLFGVGRSTVREAVRALAHAGLVEVKQGHGTFVLAAEANSAALRRRAALADVRQVTEVRRALEVEGARLAARRRTRADIRRLWAALAHRDRARTGPVDILVEKDVDFHRTVIDASHNALLVDLYVAFTARLSDALVASVEDQHLQHDSNAAHAALVGAIAAGDEEEAARAANSYLDPIIHALAHLPGSP